jgi:hypothetical protein
VASGRSSDSHCWARCFGVLRAVADVPHRNIQGNCETKHREKAESCSSRHLCWAMQAFPQFVLDSAFCLHAGRVTYVDLVAFGASVFLLAATPAHIIVLVSIRNDHRLRGIRRERRASNDDATVEDLYLERLLDILCILTVANCV